MLSADKLAKLAKKPEASAQVREKGQEARELTNTERDLARDIGVVLDQVNSGARKLEDAKAFFARAPRLRFDDKKEMSGEYLGYKELTLASKDASGGGASVMRLLFKEGPNGTVIDVKIVQMHPQ